MCSWFAMWVTIIICAVGLQCELPLLDVQLVCNVSYHYYMCSWFALWVIIIRCAVGLHCELSLLDVQLIYLHSIYIIISYTWNTSCICKYEQYTFQGKSELYLQWRALLCIVILILVRTVRTMFQILCICNLEAIF